MFYNKVEVKAIILAVYNIESLGLNENPNPPAMLGRME